MDNVEKKEKKEMGTEKMSARILDTIKNEGISPKPKWHFLLKEWVIWATAGVAFILGVVATTLTIYLANISRLMERVIQVTDTDFWFGVVPLLWVVLLVLGIFYTVYAARESKRGYKWSLSWIVSIALLSSVFLGAGVYAMGAGESIDAYLLSEVPMYQKMTQFKADHWMDIEKGVVVGMVTQVTAEDCTMIRLDTRKPLKVSFDEHTEILTPNQEIRLYAPVKVTGEEVSKDIFYAKEIKPFQGRGGNMLRPLMKPRENVQDNQAAVFRVIEKNNLHGPQNDGKKGGNY